MVGRFVGRTLRGLRRLWHTPRARERGAAIFIVLLVLTVLSAIGVFAARTAGLNQRASGYDRQGTQTGYVAEYGTTMVIDEVGSQGSMYVNMLQQTSTERCVSNQYINLDGGAVANTSCYKVFKYNLETMLTQSGSSASLFDLDGGSLGPTQRGLSPDFSVELTDLGPPGRPVAGSDVGGTGPSQRFRQITFSGIGQVRSGSTLGASCTTPAEIEAAQTAGTKTVRAVVQVLAQ